MTKSVAPRLRVLLAEGDRLNRLSMSGSLRADYEVIEAEDGPSAVAQFKGKLPDVAVLDAEISGMGGIEVVREIKRLAGDRFVPVFLVSGHASAEIMIAGLEAGADDFLPKPFNVQLFKPKLDVFLRLRSQQRRILAQNEALEAFQKETRAEQVTAALVFARMLQRSTHDDARLRMSLTAASTFNGDAVLSAYTPSGALRVLVADVSGHGLTAALGTLPLNAIFYAATARGDPLIETIQMINEELKTALPAHLFCAAVVLEVDRQANELAVVNAGMPSVFVRSKDALREYPSRSTPLGVSRRYAPIKDSISVTPGDRIFAMSDGMIERSNPEGELFGLNRVRSFLGGDVDASTFDLLLDAVTCFSRWQRDDVTLIELTV